MEDIALPMPTLSKEPLFQLLPLRIEQKEKKRIALQVPFKVYWLTGTERAKN